MNAEKKILLNKTYQLFMDMGLGKMDPVGLEEITDKQLMGFGTASDEKLFGHGQLLELILRQNEQAKGLDMSWKVVPAQHYYSNDENTAVFADDIFLQLGTGAETVEIYMRFSIVLIYENDKWLALHWHGSKPEEVQSELDTFGIEDLKQRTALLEKMVEERTAELTKQKEELENALRDLKTTQTQLIQSEKMASLGELTAGIAHEIQNPLNFVNNFSEVNLELIEELKSQKSTLKNEEQDELLDDILANSQKINHHGKRADSIVKGMLQHSRSTAHAVKEPTDINALCDEYLRLSYHGLRAKDKSFNASLKTDFDPSIEKINIIPQDIGRVVMNLLTNAFYAVNEKKASFDSLKGNVDYDPTVSISTKKIAGKVEIKLHDNGNGINQEIMDKIFQPFFTTKPTGQGTGLGLSMSYDIITKGHGGELLVETTQADDVSHTTAGTTFKIILPA